MIKAALEYLIAMAHGEERGVDSRIYSTKPWTPVKSPRAGFLTTSTLTSLADYLERNPDELNLDDVVVHVESSKRVVAVSVLNMDWQDRDQYLAAVHSIDEFAFGRYLRMEEFIIGLQAKFDQDDQVAELLRSVGNLQAGTTINILDDGVSQEVTAKTGVARLGQIKIPNPVKLRPHRTFPEVAQPAGNFALRLKDGDNSLPTAALFEADSGAWETEAIHSIRDWLKEHLPPAVTIIA